MDASRYLDLFVSEASEHLACASRLAPDLADPARRDDAARQLFRHLHSLKGLASTMSFQSLAHLTHAAEGLLQTCRAGASRPAAEDLALLLDTLTVLNRMVDRVERGAAPEEAERLIPPHSPTAGDRLSSHGATPRGPLPGAASRGSGWVRVRADGIEAVLGEARALLEAFPRPAEGGRTDLPGGPSVPLVKLYARIVELRRVPFDGVARRLARTVEDLSRELGKEVDLEIEGEHMQLDCRMLEALVDPLTHVVRNAMDHGIESSAERRAAGKPPAGRIRLRLVRGGGGVVITIEDDGRGLDPVRIKRAAVERGLIEAELAWRLDDDQARMLVTLPGFSTKEQPTTISGRGVGMDAVRAEVDRLGGRLVLESPPGHGTRVRFVLPANGSVIRALVCRCGGDSYALPLASVEHTLCPAAGAPNRPTAALTPRAPRNPTPRTVVVLREEHGGLGLEVDEIVGARDLLFERLDLAPGSLSGFAGTAVLEDDSVVIVLDPAHLRDAAPA